MKMQTFSEICPIWGTAASEDGKDLSKDQYWYDSPRAGGKFRIDGTSKKELGLSSLPQKVALTDWLVKQRRAGIEYPNVEFYLNVSFLGVRKPTVIDRMNRAIVWIGNSLQAPGDMLNLWNDPATVLYSQGIPADSGKSALKFYASIGANVLNDDEGILRLLHESGYLRTGDNQRYRPSSKSYMTPTGWQKFTDLTDHDALGSQAFIAMWFGNLMDEVYENGFVAGIKEAGYTPRRIDRIDHNNRIDDEIIAEIRRSKFVVADFTSELIERKKSNGTKFTDTFARGGVYFEAGFAKGLGKEVIWTVRQDVMDAGVLHFDTRQFAHIVWKDAADLRTQLSRRIAATLGDGPNKLT